MAGNNSVAAYPGRRLLVSAVSILILLLFYGYAFHVADRGKDLNRFDSVLVQDTAQVARNTLRGDFLQTKYITPVGYAYMHRLDNHPDYIRYPVPALTYSVLFAVFPDSPVTIKILNAALLLLNAFLMSLIFSAIIRDEDHSTGHEAAVLLIPWLTAVIASIVTLPYLRLALSDGYEMITATLFLLIILELVTKRRPVPTGLLCSILYLSRPNMGLMVVFAGLFIMQDSKTSLSRLSRLGRFAAAVIIVLVPFFIRNLHYTGKLIFSIQQSVEIAARSIPSHRALYRSFSIPPSIVSDLPDLPRWFVPKLVSNLKNGFSFALHPAYWPAWLGLPFFIYRFKRMRRVILLLVSFLIAHILIVSIYIQLFRIYIPIYIPLVAMGYLGLITAIRSKFFALFDAAGYYRRLFLIIIPVTIVCIVTITTGKSHIVPPVHRPAQLPSPQALEAIQKQGITCTYSNSPFWIPWYADIVAIYAPVDLFSIKSMGPPECRHYMFVEDPIRRLKPEDRRFLSQYGKVIEQGEKFVLYKLNLQP